MLKNSNSSINHQQLPDQELSYQRSSAHEGIAMQRSSYKYPKVPIISIPNTDNVPHLRKESTSVVLSPRSIVTRVDSIDLFPSVIHGYYMAKMVSVPGSSECILHSNNVYLHIIDDSVAAVAPDGDSNLAAADTDIASSPLRNCNNRLSDCQMVAEQWDTTGDVYGHVQVSTRDQYTTVQVDGVNDLYRNSYGRLSRSSVASISDFEMDVDQSPVLYNQNHHRQSNDIAAQMISREQSAIDQSENKSQQHQHEQHGGSRRFKLPLSIGRDFSKILPHVGHHENKGHVKNTHNAHQHHHHHHHNHSHHHHVKEYDSKSCGGDVGDLKKYQSPLRNSFVPTMDTSSSSSDSLSSISTKDQLSGEVVQCNSTPQSGLGHQKLSHDRHHSALAHLANYQQSRYSSSSLKPQIIVEEPAGGNTETAESVRDTSYGINHHKPIVNGVYSLRPLVGSTANVHNDIRDYHPDYIVVFYDPQQQSQMKSGARYSQSQSCMRKISSSTSSTCTPASESRRKRVLIEMLQQHSDACDSHLKPSSHFGPIEEVS
ncbi:hypothetical protein MIR68_003396 [Amoeboaphelidium protococcarum]|nr:hypothetical protein MIR68_003396 [Amoeboaphelidium protococcarum]